MRAEVEEAVELMQRGDDASIERALALLQNTVFSFSMRVCGHREDAEDTMQEVLLTVPQLRQKPCRSWQGLFLDSSCSRMPY